MHPILGHIGPFTIYSFGFMLAIAVLVCSSLMNRDAQKMGIAKDTVYDFVMWLLLGGVLGSRLFFILLNLPEFIADPKQIIMIQNGGLAWQGGLIVGGLAGFIFIRMKKLSLAVMADLAAPFLALGQAIGRVGCFLNGCCYGKPVEWGLYFPVHHAHLHPTQLYDTGMLLGVFLYLKQFQKTKPQDGQIFALYLILAALERFINEFFRADHINFWIGLSVFQVVSIGIFFVGIGMFSSLGRERR